jgi:hypothetical protein
MPAARNTIEARVLGGVIKRARRIGWGLHLESVGKVTSVSLCDLRDSVVNVLLIIFHHRGTEVARRHRENHFSIDSSTLIFNYTRILVTVGFVVLLTTACSSVGSRTHTEKDTHRFTDDQRHRLYAAALAASDSPMDTETFGNVCRTIGIFDQDGKPNDRYMAFVSQHIAWGTNSETEEFRRDITSKDKARQYIAQHLSAP